MMFSIAAIVKLLLKPLTSLGGKYLDNKRDKVALEHGTERIAIQADANVRAIKLGSTLLAIPLFVGEAAVVLYVGSILVDSAFPSVYLNPLELPRWFLPYFDTAMVSVFGLSAADKIATKWNRK